MKTITTLLCILSLAVCSMAADKVVRPKIKVASDGFPSGHETPEGAACDLARAFIKVDVVLFTNTCLRPFGGGENRTNYQKFLENTVQGMKQEATKKEPSPEGPKSISKVFAARHLSRNGPASAGYALFDFQDVMFADVEVTLHSGKTYVNRTMVVKISNGKWFVHPAPEIHSLLSMGLNDESASKQEFSEVYEIEK